jgi:hypothetical protein
MINQSGLNEIKKSTDLNELDKLPETIEDIEKHPILKPLLEFHKQASMLEKEDRLEHEFLMKIKEEINKDLETGIYDNSNIVKKYLNLAREYDRLILIYSRYTDLSDEKILEMKHIVEKYYITRNEHEEQVFYLQKEIDTLKRMIREMQEKKNEIKTQEIPAIPIKIEKKVENLLKNEEEYEEEEPEDEEEIEDEDESDKEYEEFLKRKLPKVTKAEPKKSIEDIKVVSLKELEEGLNISPKEKIKKKRGKNPWLEHMAKIREQYKNTDKSMPELATIARETYKGGKN